MILELSIIAGLGIAVYLTYMRVLNAKSHQNIVDPNVQPNDSIPGVGLYQSLLSSVGTLRNLMFSNSSSKQTVESVAQAGRNDDEVGGGLGIKKDL